MKGDKFLSKAFDYYCIHRMSIIVKKIQNPLVEYHTPLSIVTDIHICIHLCVVCNLSTDFVIIDFRIYGKWLASSIIQDVYFVLLEIFQLDAPVFQCSCLRWNSNSVLFTSKAQRVNR